MDKANKAINGCLFEAGGTSSPDSQIISVRGASPADFPRNGGLSD